MTRKEGYESYFDTNDLDIQKYLRAIMFNIYRIVFIVILGTSLWAIYYFNAPRIYSVYSLIHIDNGANTRTASIEELFVSGGFSDDIDLEEQISLYRSRTNQEEIIRTLDLNILYNDLPNQLPEKNPISYNKFIVSLDPNTSSIILFIEPSEDGSSYNIYDANQSFIAKDLQIGEDFSNDYIEINVKEIKTRGELIKLRYFSMDTAIDRSLSQFYLGKLLDTNWYNVGTLMRVSMQSPNTELAKLIVNTANEIFVNRSISTNAEEAQSSLKYINTQLDIVFEKLNLSELKLNNFRSKNTTISFESEVESILIQDQSIFEKLNELDLRVAELKNQYKVSNPLMIKLESQKQELIKQQLLLRERVKSLPAVQKKYVDLNREVELNQSVYENLLSRKMEFSIIEASTIGNVRIIDPAYIENKVSPNGFKSLFITWLLSGIIGLLYAIIRNNYFLPVQLPSDISDQNRGLNCLGTITFIDEISDVDDLISKDKESINSLVTNFGLINSDTNQNEEVKVIEITGSTPGIGKTTITYFLSRFMSERDKKVLLIDMDYKRGDIHELFSKKTLKDNIFEGEIDFEDFRIDRNLYFMPRPKGRASDALPIIESKGFMNFIEKAKLEFDHIIFDTPPLFSLSEPLALSKYADVIIPIFRHNVSTQRDASQFIKEFESIGRRINYFVYNGFQKPKGFYSYDYYAYKYYSADYYGNYDEKD